MKEDGGSEHENNLLLAIPTKSQLCSLLKYLLDEDEFLSPYGIRSLSKVTLLAERLFFVHVLLLSEDNASGFTSTYRQGCGVGGKMSDSGLLHVNGFRPSTFL